MNEASSTKSSNDGFWLSVAVLAVFGALIGIGFLYAYFVV